MPTATPAKKPDALAALPAADAPAKANKPKRAPRLDRFQFAAQLTQQGGKCFVLGTPLDRDAVEYGGVIVSKRARKMIGSESLGNYRVTLLRERREAQELVKLTDPLEINGVIVFAGEKASKPTSDPSPLAEQPEDAKGRLSAVGAAS